MGTSQVSLPLNLLGKNPLGVCNTPISLTRNRASCGSHHPRFKPLPARLCRATVSPAGSGPAPQWGASRTDRSGNVDRFAAERHRRSLTPSRAQTMEVFFTSLAREGDFNFNF